MEELRKPLQRGFGALKLQKEKAGRSAFLLSEHEEFTQEVVEDDNHHRGGNLCPKVGGEIERDSKWEYHFKALVAPCGEREEHAEGGERNDQGHEACLLVNSFLLYRRLR